MGVMRRLDVLELWMLEGYESVLIKGEDLLWVEANERLGEMDLSMRGMKLIRLPASLGLGVAVATLPLGENICEALAVSRRRVC
jgi:hypothetical protein